MNRNSFELNEQTLSVIEEIGGHMPGGFFIYQAEAPETLIYANRAVLNIYGCADLDDIVTTTFVLSMDSKFLCREDCKGLCCRCGKDLNDGPCGCQPDVDPRLAVLKQLLKK